jgi:hypothetical protein
MRIRHLVSADNVDGDGFVIDPPLVRHGLVIAGRIAQLAGPIDPRTHLNRDFPEHHLNDCLVAERLEAGALLHWEGERFSIARARPSAYTSLGPVDQGRQRAAWQEKLRMKKAEGRRQKLTS